MVGLNNHKDILQRKSFCDFSVPREEFVSAFEWWDLSISARRLEAVNMYYVLLEVMVVAPKVYSQHACAVLQNLPTELCRFRIFVFVEKHFTKYIVFLQKDTSA